MNRKLNISIENNIIKIKNITDIVIENCLIQIQNILYGNVLYENFSIQPDQELSFNINVDNFINEWINEKLFVKVFSNHKLIYDKTLNDKTKCFVLLSNKKFELLAEQLIVGLDKYTDIDILHYTIGYYSNLEYTNLTNVLFNIDGDINDAHYMQFSKAPVFLDVIERGYDNAIFLDADIQVKSNILKLVDLINEIEDGPILQKGAYDYTIVHGEYVPGPLVSNLLNLPKQKYPHGITNIVIFNKKHKELFTIWNDICFSNEIRTIKEKEFLHDELLLNCLMWRENIKPKYFYVGLNITNLQDVNFFYNYNNNNSIQSVDMNEFDLGHPYQSFIPYDKSEITFFHCIKDSEVAKKINEYIHMKEVNKSFKNDLLAFYDDINIVDERIKKIKPQINVSFINGAQVEIGGDNEITYDVILKNKKNNEIIFKSSINGGMWTKSSLRYYIDYIVEVYENNELIYNYTLDLTDKTVYISFESSSLGDTLAWIPYVDEFRKKHNCKVIVSTFMNSLFIDQYKHITFVNPGENVLNIFAQYQIGWFYNDDTNQFDNFRNPLDFKTQPMQKTATDILGLEYKEIKPLLNLPIAEKIPKVGIAIHGTAQAKYWNNPNGWQEVVDYLNQLGYEVMLYSKEDHNYMGNKHPNGIKKFKGGSIQDVIDDLVTCEFFIGIGSGLSWLAWACNLPVVLISGFSEEYTETVSNTYRVINKDVCTGCFNKHRLNPADWNWCPENKNTYKHYECTKKITSKMVIEQIKNII